MRPFCFGRHFPTLDLIYDERISTTTIAGLRTGGRLTFLARARKVSKRTRPSAPVPFCCFGNTARRPRVSAFGRALMRRPALSVLRWRPCQRTRTLPRARRLARMGAPGSSWVGWLRFFFFYVSSPRRRGSSVFPGFKSLDSRLRGNDGAIFCFCAQRAVDFPPVRRAEQRNAVWVNSQERTRRGEAWMPKPFQTVHGCTV